MSTRDTGLNHVRTTAYPNARIEADDAKKRGRLVLDS